MKEGGLEPEQKTESVSTADATRVQLTLVWLHHVTHTNIYAKYTLNKRIKHGNSNIIEVQIAQFSFSSSSNHWKQKN